MHAADLDPNYLLPLWRALVDHFRTYPPLVQGPQQLELPLVPTGGKVRRPSRPFAYLPEALERRLPIQPSP